MFYWCVYHVDKEHDTNGKHFNIYEQSYHFYKPFNVIYFTTLWIAYSTNDDEYTIELLIQSKVWL